MAVTIQADGLTTTNVISYSVQEDATPIDASSSAGGAGQITLTTLDFPDAPLLRGRIELADGARGKISGTMRPLAASDGILTITADSPLAKFNAERTIQPFVGTLEDAILYYCDLVGIDNDIVVDTSLASRPVVYPGLKGNVWTYIKQLMAVEEIEIAVVFDRVYVRPLRTLTIDRERHTQRGWSLDDNNSARFIDVNYYKYTYGTQKEVYPVPKADKEPTIISVGAGKTVTITQQLNASMFSVNQPVATNFVNDESYAGTDGVYSVSGNDGKPVTAAQWTNQGGKVTVSLTDDPSIIKITVKGAWGKRLAPYRIAMTSGSNNYYNSLHITGTAIVSDKKTLRLKTGLRSTETGVEVGTTIDNKFVNSLSDAYNAGMRAAASYSGFNYTISGSAFDINRPTAGRDLIQPTIADFNLTYIPGTPISTFNSVWTGQTIGQFNTYWSERTDDLWANQMFGNAPGARVMNGDVNFRINTVTTTESTVQYTAQLDTLVSDFNAEWATTDTIDSFNTEFAGRTMREFSLIPLRRTT